jgi:hypothetical protein
MRNQVFRGMLVTAVPATEAARRDLARGAAARSVDALIAALDGGKANPLQNLLREERPRLAAIQSRALLVAALGELLGRTDVEPLADCQGPARVAA